MIIHSRLRNIYSTNIYRRSSNSSKVFYNLQCLFYYCTFLVPLNNSGRRGLSLVVGIVYVLFRSSETMKTLNLSFTWGKGLSLKIWRAKALSGTLFSKRDFLGTFLRKCELSHSVFTKNEIWQVISTNDTSDSWDLPNKFLTGGISSLLICLVGIYQKSVWLGVFWYLRFDSGGFTETVICRWDFAYLESDAVNYAIHEAVREYSALIVWRLGNCCFGFWHELFHKIPFSFFDVSYPLWSF